MNIKPDMNGPLNLCGPNNYCGDWWLWTGDVQVTRYKKKTEYNTDINNTYCPGYHCYLKGEKIGESQICIDPKEIPEKYKCENRTFYGHKLATVKKTQYIVPDKQSNIQMCGPPGATWKAYCGNGWRKDGMLDVYAPYGYLEAMCPTNSCYLPYNSKNENGTIHSQACMAPEIPLTPHFQ
jgi:hypothetical protein